MAKKTEIKPIVHDHITQEELGEVVDSAFTRYAFKVIEDRAIPDARDGLKPSQRRILYAMDQLGLGPTKKHMKCAKIVGETMGNYHPHGDASLYGTLVGMAQPWSMRTTLVDPQGNFGSVDNDPAAAQRYTEARLSHAGMALLDNVSPRVVDFKRTYDDSREEPTVLPAMLPNLLLNGGTGISVGWATNIPPHNLRELVKVFEAYIKNPNITSKEIIRLMPGPDFPTGGKLLGQEGVYEYYETGRGSLKIEGVYEVKTEAKGNSTIVVTEFPEGGSPEKFRNEIKDLIEKGKISGITDIANYSSNKIGTKVVVEVGRNANINVILNHILTHTCLRVSFSANNTVLIGGKLFDKAPITRLIKAFIDHRQDVLTRRFNGELCDALARIEILDGLISVSSRIDEVIKIVRESENSEAAQAILLAKKIVTTENQAKAVMAITLARLTKLEHHNLLDEKKKKEETVAWLKKTLSNVQDILDIIIEEQKTLADKLGNDRRTTIECAASDIQVADLIDVEDVVVSITTDDYIKRVSLDQYKKQNRGGVGVKGGELKEDHFIQSMFSASTHDDLLCFTDSGRVFSIKVFEIPAANRAARGRPIVNLVNLKDGEKICAYLPIKNVDKQTMFFSFLSKDGLIKRTCMKEFSRINSGGKIAVKIKDDDKIVSVLVSKGIDDFLLVTNLGKAIRFSELDIRLAGRNASGSIAIRLDKGDSVIGGITVPMKFDADGDAVTEDTDLTTMTITSKGYCKRTSVDEYLTAPVNGGKLTHQNRGGKGRIDINLDAKMGKSIGVIPIKDGNDIVAITKQGQMVRVAANSFRAMSRRTNGSKIIKLSDNDEVISACPVAKEVEEDSDSEVVEQVN